jgi:O-palmitoleoyl-L-serine hydrolase
VIFMEGGGWCGSDADCVSRSLTDLGSSSKYPQMMANAEGEGLYAQFATFSIVYMKYCDGGSFTGDVDAPVVVKSQKTTTTIFYRGRRILDALFEELLALRGLDKANQLLFAGCSAGALTTYVHADYVSELMSRRVPGVVTVALADAMFSLHHDAFPANAHNYYTQQFTWGYEAWNSSASINQRCRAAYGGGQPAWQCFHGAVAAQYVETPLFIANSKYDTWQARGVLGLNTTECPASVAPDGTVNLCWTNTSNALAEARFWVAYGDSMVAALNNSLLSRRHAAFLTNCPTHCQTDPTGFRHPASPGTALGVAVKQWYPQAIKNARDASWKAPRWVAADGDKCLLEPAAPEPACSGPLNETTQCKYDAGKGLQQMACPWDQPLCKGFVEGKRWGHCCK